MRNYNNGKIYKIEPICAHEENEIYIGSTTKELLCQRLAEHKHGCKSWIKNNIKYYKHYSYLLFEKYGIDNCQIVLLESVNANNKDELFAREAHYIRTLKCINNNIPLRSDKEYKQDKKEEIKIQRKEFYDTNRERLLQDKRNDYEKHRETRLVKGKERYQKNREEILKKQSEPVICECGTTFHGHKARHNKSKKHIFYIENKN